MTKYRIGQHINHNGIKGHFFIQIKRRWNWETLYSSYEEYKDGKITNKSFETFDAAETYFIQKHCSGGYTFCDKIGNEYHVTRLSLSYI